MGIPENVADRKAAEDLIRTVGDLLKPEVKALPSDRSRAIFWQMLAERVDKRLGKRPSPPAQRAPRRADLPPDDEVEAALEQCDELLERIGELPSKADDFAASVKETVESIRESIDSRQKFTSGQAEALENIERGVGAWFHE